MRIGNLYKRKASHEGIRIVKRQRVYIGQSTNTVIGKTKSPTNNLFGLIDSTRRCLANNRWGQDLSI